MERTRQEMPTISLCPRPYQAYLEFHRTNRPLTHASPLHLTAFVLARGLRARATVATLFDDAPCTSSWGFLPEVELLPGAFLNSCCDSQQPPEEAAWHRMLQPSLPDWLHKVVHSIMAMQNLQMNCLSLKLLFPVEALKFTVLTDFWVQAPKSSSSSSYFGCWKKHAQAAVFVPFLPMFSAFGGCDLGGLGGRDLCGLGHGEASRAPGIRRCLDEV